MNTSTQKQVIFLFVLYIMTLCLFSNLYAQCNKGILKTPDEYVKNRLHGDNMIYGHPYTIFNKRYLDFNLKAEIDSIRKQIQKEKSEGGVGPVYKSYLAVLDQADNVRPVDVKSDETDDYSKLAVWAKYNAFMCQWLLMEWW